MEITRTHLLTAPIFNLPHSLAMALEFILFPVRSTSQSVNASRMLHSKTTFRICGRHEHGLLAYPQKLIGGYFKSLPSRSANMETIRYAPKRGEISVNEYAAYNRGT